MPSRRELYAGVTFFALAAVVVVAVRRPFDMTGWACLLACVIFVAFGCAALLKPDLAVGMRKSEPSAKRKATANLGDDLDDEGDEASGDPSPHETRILDATISALAAVEAIEADEVDARSLWKAAQRLDPGQTIGAHEALGSFSALHEFDRRRIGRLTFVPAHTEYDGPLLAEITASMLVSLGWPVHPDEVEVALPADGGQGPATISFPVDGCTETVTCSYLWKYPPTDLPTALGRFARDDDPCELVGADPGDQTLLYATIRSGTLAELNRRLPAEHNLFYKA